MSVHQERREGQSQRIPFDAIVDIGSEIGSTSTVAFEAQGVDLSASGMQLRTAYLPDLGQSLLCRFGSGAQEVSASAEVVWRREGTRGGDFGVRFTNLDGPSEATLWDMCGVARHDGPELRQSPDHAEVSAGTRVRLHIDGLGSPMKARVRGVSGNELLVGSNLEFLRVGRTLELEDVDRGGKRPAHIDRVDVELDRASNVPQLVVTLRYDDADAAAADADAPAAAAHAAYVPAAREPLAPVELSAVPPVVHVAALPSARVAHGTPELTPETREAREDIDAARMMRSRVSAAAADVLPKFAALGARAKTTVGLLLARASERAHQNDADARRRITSPPPGGALHAAGKRVFREGSEQEPPALRGTGALRPKLGRHAMMAFGGAAALLVVVTSMAFFKTSAPPPGSATGDAALVSAPATSPVNAALALDPGSAPPLQANVPLFGPTILSTTEPVAAAPPSAAPVVPGFGGFGLAVSGASATAAPTALNPSAPIDAVDDRRASRTDDRRASHDEASSGSSAAPWVPAFTHGRLKNANVFRLKTDGTITEMHGGRLPTGFTLTVPHRRALESGAALAARDPRIASVHITNGAKGAELSVQFKDGLPAYAVRAKGRELQIALGGPDRFADRPGAPSRTADRARATSQPSRGVTATKMATEHQRAKKDR